MSRARILLLAGVVTFGLVVAGCESRQGKQGAGTPAAAAAAATPKICAKCGQIKGTDVCCKDGAELCAHCGLVKGSPGCCRIPKGTTEDVALCTKCGQIKGTDACCKGGAELCPKCGLAKGSPGCCRIPKKQP